MPLILTTSTLTGEHQDEDLGNWEPSYDLARLHDDNILSLFVLPVQQGNHERTTTFPPQQAVILETPLP